jgi:AraC-like DNA-binding protein
LIDLLFALALIQGCWLFYAIWRDRMLNPAGQPHLLVLLSSLLLVMAEAWILYQPWSQQWPVLAGMTAALPLMFGPALYGYVSSITARSFRPWLHYAPGVLCSLAIWLSPLWSLLMPPMLLLVGLKLLSLYGYLLLSLMCLRRQTDILSRRLRQLSMALLLLVSVALLLFMAEQQGWQFWPGSDLLAGLGLALFVYGVSLVVLREWQNYIWTLQPQRLPLAIVATGGREITTSEADSVEAAQATHVSQVTHGSPVRTELLNEDTAQQVFAELQQLLQTQQLWQQSQFRLADLAAQSGFAEHYISYVVNKFAGCNLQTWLNTFRVQQAAMLLCSSDRPILEIALAVGFNSKATFNRVFKTLQGVTPSEHRQQCGR